MTFEEDHTTASPLEEARLVNSRRNQLQDLAQSSDEDVSELAWADLSREFGISKFAEDTYDEFFNS